MTTPLPDTEQEARAKWDLLLTDLEYRQAQQRRIYQEMDATTQEMQLRTAQIQRVGQETRLAPWQLAFGGFSAGAAWAAVIFAIAKLL
jgi:hypothetical protein